MSLISDNGISRVWREGIWVYKKQPKHLAQNEIWCLEQLYQYGVALYAEQVDEETVRMPFLERHPITETLQIKYEAQWVLGVLETAGIRHGDLTAPNVIVNSNRIYLIDFAESRLACDPRPDKRPEGDEYWLTRTIKEFIDASSQY